MCWLLPSFHKVPLTREISTWWLNVCDETIIVVGGGLGGEDTIHSQLIGFYSYCLRPAVPIKKQRAEREGRLEDWKGGVVGGLDHWAAKTTPMKEVALWNQTG